MDVDYRLAFNLAPVGCACRATGPLWTATSSCAKCSARRGSADRQSFQVLYRVRTNTSGWRTDDPDPERQGHYADDRIMKRASGEVFWCHVTGRA